MNNTTFNQFRKAMQLSIADCALIWGVSERSVRRWITGMHPISEGIERDVLTWLRWMNQAYDTLVELIEAQIEVHDNITIRLPIYSSKDDYQINDDDVPYQLANAVNTWVGVLFFQHIQLVAFYFDQYQAWLDDLGYGDNRQMRGQFVAQSPQ